MRNSDQEFFTNQKGVVYSVSQDTEVLQRPSYFTNMDEADMRIWCVHISGQRSHWSSSGTAHTQQNHCHLTQHKSGGFSKFPSPSCFVAGTSRRPRFVQHPTHPSVTSTTVIVCVHWVSFFVGVGKCTFLATFSQYASPSSLVVEIHPPGSIGLVSLNCDDLSFYSFTSDWLDVHTSGHIHQRLRTLHQCHSTIP